MSNQDENSTLHMAAIIGVIGVGVLSLLFVIRRKEEPPLNAIGQTIMHIGEIFQSHGISEPAPMKKIEKKIQKNENTVSQVVDWIAAGIELWKKFKS